MKILLIAPQPFYQERGTPIAVKLLAQTLGQSGHNVHLLVFHEGERVDIPGVTIHRNMTLPGITGIKPGLSLKKLVCDFFLALKCFSLVRREKFDLVHAVEEAVFIALMIKKVFRIPYIYDMDSCMSVQLADKFSILRIVVPVMEWLEKKAIVGSKGVVAVCRALEENVQKFAPGKPVVRLEDISLLATGVEGNELLRECLGINGTLLMYIGNLEEYQGVGLLLEGMSFALRQHEDLNLVIIGGREKDITFYRQESENLGIQKKVFFCGPRPVELLGYYLRQADILVSPRTQGNNTPMKIYSYLDSGRPVLATRLPTHTQVLDDAISLLVNADPVAMAAGIVRLADNRDFREALGSSARERVAQEYSYPAFQRKLLGFYQRMSVD